MEEFLLRKLKREAEKRQSSMTMEQIKEEVANENELEENATNQNGDHITTPDLKPRGPINDQEKEEYGHMTYNNEHGEYNGHNVDMLINCQEEFIERKEKNTQNGNHVSSGRKSSSPFSNGSTRKDSPNHPVARPKSRQSPPAGKYLVRDLEEQNYLVNLPRLKHGKGVERNQQTD